VPKPLPSKAVFPRERATDTEQKRTDTGGHHVAMLPRHGQQGRSTTPDGVGSAWGGNPREGTMNKWTCELS